MADYQHHEADVLVVGGGIAAAFAAIRARELGARVVLVDKAFFGRSGVSALASGVFAAWMPGDDMRRWHRSSPGPLVDRPAYERAMLVTYDLLRMMDAWGVKWVKSGGEIVRVKGGSTPFPSNAMMAEGGPQMMMALRNQTVRCGVQVVNRVMVTDLLTSDGQHPTSGGVVGAVGFHTQSGEIHVFRAGATVLCTGPIGFPYPRVGRALHGMPINSTGDGAAAAFRAGAQLRKIELSGGQLFPAEFRSAPALEMGTALGMRFYNRDGEELLGDKAPEDRIRTEMAIAIRKEYAEGRGPVYMRIPDLTMESLMLLKRVVPIVSNTFERAGYIIGEDMIPYADLFPTQWGISGGGIRANERGETSVPGLYGAGNATDGAFIAATQPLHICAVLGWYAGENATKNGGASADPNPGQVDQLVEEITGLMQRRDGVRFDQARDALEALYGQQITRVLNGQRIEAALERVAQMRRDLVPRLSAPEPRELAKAIGLRNFAELLEVALTVLSHRTESRANAMREDYPYTDNVNWLSYTVATRSGGGVQLVDEPLPEGGTHWLPKERTQVPHPFFRS